MSANIPVSEGRAVFGHSAAAYDAVRPAYPQWMFQQLRNLGVLGPATSTLEIGAGNGLASRPLIEHGATPLLLVEPDQRFQHYLSRLATIEGVSCRVIYEPFESCQLPLGTFDLIVIATAFHWLQPGVRVQRLAELVRPGGHVVLMWNVFQDLTRRDDFHDATATLLASLASSPSGAPDALPFALDKVARDAEFIGSGRFERAFYGESYGSLDLDTDGVRSLYAGFSGVSRLPDAQRAALLDELAAVAEQQFGGHVVRNMTSPLYVYQRSR